MYNLGKKFLVCILFVFVVSFLFSTEIALGKESSFDDSQSDNGMIIVNYIPKKNVLTKVMISKDNSTYTYTLDAENRFPLQLGNGSYNVSILENVKDNKYRLLEMETIQVKISAETQIYLQSTQIINWNSKMDAIKKAKELTKYKKTEIEKVKAIYNYIIKNIDYDKEKAKSVASDYIPSIDDVLSNNKGICYDYAVLFAAMLRSVDIPTKVLFGNKVDLKEYHAWNQVYLSDKNKWVTIDTTYDSALIKSKKVNIIKDSQDYTIKKIY